MAPNRSVSRRGFLRFEFLHRGKGREADRRQPVSAPVRAAVPLHRPPGAVAEEQFLKGCTKCDRCIEACPHDAIQKAPIKLGPATGTPVIDPSVEPCWMCPDMPCIPACPEGILLSEGPVKMGEARIQKHDCLAHQNGFCTACSERCPVPGAIRLEENKPVVVPEICTGCGVCQYVCPAPRNAVMILPSARRSLPPRGSDDDGG